VRRRCDRRVQGYGGVTERAGNIRVVRVENRQRQGQNRRDGRQTTTDRGNIDRDDVGGCR